MLFSLFQARMGEPCMLMSGVVVAGCCYIVVGSVRGD